ncbi:cellulose biosynthesis protein BcsQ [Bordetella hinzii]|uniref:Cellulose synthase operon protein YhjQ n=2 Tax=Bordetella hinzii TaxID=103855 RepID=A0AAN1S1D8_9BORD|nr:cellulose biosynthesis protein BcsQ [Bordetella hinzii]AKQ54985.1 Chromosome-partitioning ATPase Soj [Bordetella hinzii]AKQ59496.1 Chromosome-partitioning ATPase Soj [Bordetella hinzii]AZW19357.1 cellulose synthase operon protein YhjQ [Bordetella hinzii]KCB24770.1 cellulose synthase operon protein YhjQ [Bordetella hinzii OH87 BAL007II]KCB27789.1 cellulose synthase operon protein YhjQ [Bordetella hinzii CA90 BAL1384]
MKTIAIVSAKGGVGKTTIAATLGLALSRAGHPALVLDLDPQNALRFHLGADTEAAESGLARASLAGMRWRDAAVQGDAGLHLVPFGQLNETDRLALEQQMLREPDWLARHLRELDLAPGTLVLIDTPPGPSVYVTQALRCADLVLVVTLPDAASYATLPQVESLIAQYAQGREGYLGHAFIVNQVDSMSALAKDTLRVMRSILGERMGGVVHRDATVSEALAFGKTVIDHAPQSQACSDILASAQWLRQQLTDAKKDRP